MLRTTPTGRVPRHLVARKRRRRSSPRRPLRWDSKFLLNFILRLFENLGTLRLHLEDYLAGDGEFRWASACSGSESPHWVFKALASVGAQISFHQTYAAEMSKPKRQWILDHAHPSALFGCIFDITRAHAHCYATGDSNLDVSALCHFLQDLFIAGFSCKTVSALNPDAETRKSSITSFHGTTGLTWWGVVLVLQMQQPRSFILENVEGLMRHGLHLIIEAKLVALGYIVVWKLCNSLECGMPQSRPRIWFCGWKASLISAPERFKLHMTEVMAKLFHDHPVTDVEEFLMPEDHPHLMEFDASASTARKTSRKGTKWIEKDQVLRSKKGLTHVGTNWRAELDLVYPEYLRLSERCKSALDRHDVQFPEALPTIIRLDQSEAGQHAKFQVCKTSNVFTGTTST